MNAKDMASKLALYRSVLVALERQSSAALALAPLGSDGHDYAAGVNGGNRQALAAFDYFLPELSAPSSKDPS
jgi:hypothetical protein